MSLPIDIRDSQLGATFAVRIHPRAATTAITGTRDGALKLSVSAPPADGRANDALVEFFAELFHTPRPAIQILSGAHARTKVIRVVGRNASELRFALLKHFTV